MARTPYGFQMSPYLQELVAWMGQSCVFEEASIGMEKLCRVEVTAKQVERVSHGYGQLLEQDLDDPEQDESGSPSVAKEESLHYLMLDGAMVLTREDDWKEMKLARIFNAKSILPENERRNFIRDSQYIAHLGGHSPFFKKETK